MTARKIPMLFSKPMVLALLAGRKTQTRRLRFAGKPGDLIWVRESWRTYVSLDGEKPSRVWTPDGTRGAAIFYEAGGDQFISKPPHALEWSQSDESEHPGAGKLRPSMFLPAWGSRLTLKVTEVRRVTLHEISEADARAEGCPISAAGVPYDPPEPQIDSWQGYARASYALLWSQLNGADSWQANPTVSVVSFEVARENILSFTMEKEEPSCAF